MGFSCGDAFDEKETQVPLREEIGEKGRNGGASTRGQEMEVEFEFKPMEYPLEFKPTECHPVEFKPIEYHPVEFRPTEYHPVEFKPIDHPAEFKPIDHPIEPSDEDRPVKCPISGSSVLNDGGMREERFSESLRKRVELSSMVNEEGIIVVPTEPPARAVRKRHHTLTLDHAVLPPLFGGGLLSPQSPHNMASFHQALEQCNEFDSCQDITAIIE
ncbi:PREDICTED: uncharacterized protein LOC104587573 [Nelumbo nucifera]|uniref:Uncharacterized protein LOC104587573 n=2 Tax=Nelumbo nucifera TaxID=4432 RepID=A0A1U7YZE1_NELNU|nr:PREDICTED: uncharacterized protein LOC104587573 [Nelumbo nucifera]DAD35861.1 TPA_asm: hypothetical protein HUJ06_006501 [Nelumbo nucifera]